MTTLVRLAACVTIVLTAACARDERPRPPATPDNVLIITIDTLRADRLGVYGAAAVATPTLDRLAREGTFAPQATVPAPLTRPSHVSMFTGLYPAEHGIRDNIAPPLRADVPVLAALFAQQGFATAAFVASAVLDRQSGLSRGFERYADRFADGADRRSGDQVIAEATAWLQGKRRRFFAWVHLYDPHAPYLPPPPYAAQYAGRPYDGTVAWSDELVGRLVSALRDAGTLDRTLVVVTSDHGEGLGDHGEDVHGYFIYEATLRVPLILHGPGVKPGSRIAGVARSIDLFPTILELAGLGAHLSPSSGRSLVPAMDGRAIDEPAFAESLVPLLHYGWSDLRAVRDGRWKYILAPRPELYDLDKDPKEQTNLVEAEPARARALNAGLRARLAQEQQSARTDTARAAIPPELLEKLGALGYVSPGGPADTRAAGADPKDKLDDYKAFSTQMQQGLIALRERRPAETIAHFRDLAKRGMDGYELHFYLGHAYAAQQQWRDAAAEYAHAVDKVPGDVPAWRALGESRVELGDSTGAATAFEKLVSLAPRDALAHMELGQVYRDRHQWEAAIREMRAAVEIDPKPAPYWNALGTVLAGGTQMADAEKAFAEAVARDANGALYVYNHALALQQLGRRDEALAALRRAAALGYQPAAELLRSK